MQISKNFTLEEFYKSSTASRKGINNMPPKAEMENIKRLITEIMQPIRDAWGDSIIIGSGFRCKKLNTAVGGASNSDHLFGAACDFHTKTDSLADNMKLWNVVMKLKEEGKIKARQIIFEYGQKKVGPDWIHISINHPMNGKKDNQIVYIGAK